MELTHPRWGAVLLGAALLVHSRQLRAEPPPADGGPSLRLRTSPGCPGIDELQARLSRLVGDERARGLRASVEVTPRQDRTELRLTVGNGPDERTRILETSSCETALDAAVLLLAMSVSVPPTAAPTDQAAPKAHESSLPALGPESSDKKAPRPVVDRRETDALPRFLAGATVGTVATTLPSPGWSLGGVAAVRARSYLWLEVDGSYVPLQTTTISGEVGGAFSLFTLGARACVPIGRAKLELDFCAGAAIFGLHGEGRGVPQPRSADSWFWGPEAGIGLHVRFTSFLGARAVGFANVPVDRRRFTIDDSKVVAQPGVVGLRFAIGPEVLF